ncbi:MAG: hypothetical protein DLM73_04585 [Chthoniobacterales bacterium]|nr:MAG: hypothetical protein DLM73_04585 [Chthoniobacterales bacterium]
MSDSAVSKSDDLSSYLNDHLAGSVGALELLDRLIETYEGKPLERFFRDLRGDIQRDQEKLQELIRELGEEESAVRKAGAWVVEKFSRAKISLSDSRAGEMGLFLALESLVLGITGKQSLWRALAAASATMPQLGRLDYSELEKRAEAQRDQVEAKRLEIARDIFQPD